MICTPTSAGRLPRPPGYGWAVYSRSCRHLPVVAPGACRGASVGEFSSPLRPQSDDSSGRSDCGWAAPLQSSGPLPDVSARLVRAPYRCLEPLAVSRTRSRRSRATLGRSARVRRLRTDQGEVESSMPALSRWASGGSPCSHRSPLPLALAPPHAVKRVSLPVEVPECSPWPLLFGAPRPRLLPPMLQPPDCPTMPILPSEMCECLVLGLAQYLDAAEDLL